MEIKAASPAIIIDSNNFLLNEGGISNDNTSNAIGVNAIACPLYHRAAVGAQVPMALQNRMLDRETDGVRGILALSAATSTGLRGGCDATCACE